MIDPFLSGLLPRLLLLGVPAVVLSAILVRRMIRLAVMDVPGARSLHEQPTPRGGGVGLVAAVLLGVPVGLLLLPETDMHLLSAVLLLLAVLVLAAVSWLDDLKQFSPLLKLLAQCAASALGVMAAMSGPLALHGIALAAFYVAGFCWLMLCTNAINFADGLNGLVSGVCVLCGAITVPVGIAVADPLLCLAGLLMTAGLLGFLPFNFPHARIFLGDVGSQPCGLLVGALPLLLLAESGSVALSLLVPLMLTGLLFDVIFTLTRRLIARERITQAHRGHLYQVASRTGLSRTTVTCIEWGFALWGGVVGWLLLPEQPVSAALLALVPQIGWLVLVRQRAERAGLTRWS